MSRKNFLTTLEDIANDASPDDLEGIDYFNALFDTPKSADRKSHEHDGIDDIQIANIQNEENQNKNVFNSK